MLCLDDCFATTTMPQPTEITQFIFGQPLSAQPAVAAVPLRNRRRDVLLCMPYSPDSSQFITCASASFQPIATASPSAKAAVSKDWSERVIVSSSAQSVSRRSLTTEPWYSTDATRDWSP